jgi:hypothetical protein
MAREEVPEGNLDGVGKAKDAWAVCAAPGASLSCRERPRLQQPRYG